MNLYLVRCKGMTAGHGTAYVLAKDAGEAYRILRVHLDEKDYGFEKECAMDSVTLLAEDGEYPECGVRLFWPGPSALDASCPSDPGQKENRT